jgi:hypothetical protein
VDNLCSLGSDMTRDCMLVSLGARVGGRRVSRSSFQKSDRHAMIKPSEWCQ